MRGEKLTCIGMLLPIVKLGIGGRALYVFVRAVSGLPNMDPDVKDTEMKWGETGVGINI